MSDSTQPQIELHACPGVVITWDDFCASHPPFSIALDGYVDGVPSFDSSGPYANFDHHFGVNRLATRSTAGQVLVAVSLGLFDAFCKDGAPFANVYVNDCDQDVCLSYWMLAHPDQVRQFRPEMDIAKLIIGEDFLDATAGAYPIHPNRPMLRKLAWVFEIYEDARSSGRLAEMDDVEMKTLIEQTCDRITALSAGQGLEVEVKGKYTILGGGNGWKLVRESATYARTMLFADGVRAFVAVRDRSNGRFDYSIGKMSPFVMFPINEIYNKLNQLEGCDDDRWGGSDTIGGSPRQNGSGLAPKEIEDVINTLLAESG